MIILEEVSWESGLIIELRKSMAVRGLKFVETGSKEYVLCTKGGVYLEGLHNPKTWAKRILNHKKHNAKAEVDAKKDGEK